MVYQFLRQSKVDDMPDTSVTDQNAKSLPPNNKNLLNVQEQDNKHKFLRSSDNLILGL